MVDALIEMVTSHGVDHVGIIGIEEHRLRHSFILKGQTKPTFMARGFTQVKSIFTGDGHDASPLSKSRSFDRRLEEVTNAFPSTGRTTLIMGQVKVP